MTAMHRWHLKQATRPKLQSDDSSAIFHKLVASKPCMSRSYKEQLQVIIAASRRFSQFGIIISVSPSTSTYHIYISTKIPRSRV